MESYMSVASMAPPTPHSEGADSKKSWVRGKLLGSGSYGRVHMGIDVFNGNLFAVKSAGGADSQSEAKNIADLNALENEISIMRDINHSKVIQYLGSDWSVESGRRVRHLRVEHMPGGSLSDLIKDMGGHLEESLIKKYTRDIVSGLAYLHSLDIVHGDIKGKNILVGQGSVKIADFGTAWKLNTPKSSVPSKSSTENLTGNTALTENTTETVTEASMGGWTGKVAEKGRGNATENGTESTAMLCDKTGVSVKLGGGVKGTIAYMSPEAAKEESDQSSKIDIWSLGCTVMEMASGLSPWSEITGGAFAVLYAISCTKKLPKMPPGLNPNAINFISKCLNRDPSKRPSAIELLNHPFLAERSNLISRKPSPIFISSPSAQESNRMYYQPPSRTSLSLSSPFSSALSSPLYSSPSSPSLIPPSPSFTNPPSCTPPSPTTVFTPPQRSNSNGSPSPLWTPWHSSETDPLSFSPSLSFEDPNVSNFSLEKNEGAFDANNTRKAYHSAINRGKGSLAQFRAAKRSANTAGIDEIFEEKEIQGQKRIRNPKCLSPMEISTVNMVEESEIRAPVTPAITGMNGTEIEQRTVKGTEYGWSGNDSGFCNSSLGMFADGGEPRKWIVVRSPK